jgi:4-phosphopantoate--beta-alanine ligase
LIALGKQVLVVDLNPLSRTARRATITIVDEVSRTLDLLSAALLTNPEPTDFDNSANLRAALQVMAESAERL